MKIYKILFLIVMLTLTCSGCSDTGIGGNMELLEEMKSLENTVEDLDKSDIDYCTFGANEEDIKKVLLSSDFNLSEEKIDEYCVRLNEKSELYTIEIFDDVIDGKSVGCQDIDIYYSEKMIKQYSDKNIVLLKTILKQIGLKYNKTIQRNLKKMIARKDNNQYLEQEYQNKAMLYYGWQNEKLKFRIEAMDFNNTKAVAFNFNRQDIREKLQDSKISVSEVASDSDGDLVKNILTLKSNDDLFKIIIRDNGQDIKEDINTEAVNIEIVSKKLSDNASYSKVCDMLGCILGLIDEKINRQNVEDYISQLIKLEHSEEHSKDLKADNVCMLYMNNKDGVAEIVLLPE